MNEKFGTLSETINRLIKLGYTQDFNTEIEYLICLRTNERLSPKDFQIDQVFRFEGESDPEYQSILYAISSPKHNLKGTLVNGYGPSSNEDTSRLIEKLRTNQVMEIIEDKVNNATALLPEGNRILEAPLVEMNLKNEITQLKSEVTWTTSDPNAQTLYKSETMRIVLIGLHKNAEIKNHKAKGEISVQVLEGKINFITNQQDSIMDKGQMIALQANLDHRIFALTESFILLTIVV